MEDLGNGPIKDVHGTRLKFHSDASLDTRAFMLHDISSETGMHVTEILHLVETEDGLKFLVRWKGLGPN